MVKEEFIDLLESPDSVDEEMIQPLRQMLNYAPYCSAARLLLLKALYNSRNCLFSTLLPMTLMYVDNQEDVLNLLKPVMPQVNCDYGDDYFSLIRQLEDMSKRTGESFEELARKFQEARKAMLEQ